MSMKKRSTIASLVIATFSVLLLNMLAHFSHFNIDLTAEKRFTLSKGTESLLQKTKQPVTIKVFLKGNYPGAFRKLGAASEDLLRKFREISGPSLQYQLISP